MNRRHKEEFLSGCRIVFDRLVRREILPQYIDEVFWDYLMENDFNLADIKKKMQRALETGSVDYGMVGKELAKIALGYPRTHSSYVVYVKSVGFEPAGYQRSGMIRYQEYQDEDDGWDRIILDSDQVQNMIWLKNKNDISSLIAEVNEFDSLESDDFSVPTILSKYAYRGIDNLAAGTVFYTKLGFVEPVEEDDEHGGWVRVKVVGAAINEHQIDILRNPFRHLIPIGI